MASPRVINFGCRLNAFEARLIETSAQKAGLGDAVIFNTCAVTTEAQRQARQAVRKVHRENTGTRIIVTGCAAQIAPDSFASMPEVDQVLGNQEKLRTASYKPRPVTQPPAGKIQVSDIMAATRLVPAELEDFGDRARAFVQVQNGCDHRCTFCVIPFGRGNSRSVPVDEVIQQIARLADKGYGEVVLTGVDITAFGNDLPGAPKLGDLVLEILKSVPGLCRLRLSSIDSVEADPALIAAFSNHERLMPHVHLSLQAGDDMILKRMKRRHSRADSIAFCRQLRQLRPDVVFGADLIAGFPTETEAMFEQTKTLIKDCGLTYLHVFPYSARPGTPAARMPQLDGGTIRKRARILRETGQRQLTRFLSGHKGTVCKVLTEKPGIGRTAQYAPVRFAGRAEPGELIDVEISGSNDTHLTGQVCP